MTASNWKAEGYVLKHCETDDLIGADEFRNLVVTAYSPRCERVGMVTISFAKDGSAPLEALRADVLQDHRRKGLCTAMYDLAEEILRGKIVPSASLSLQSLAFWRQRNPALVAHLNEEQVSRHEV